MDWGRLSELVRRRRLTLELTHEELARRAGVTRVTVSRLENGNRVAIRSLYRLDRGLGWQPGSSEDILNGGEPLPLDGDDEPRAPTPAEAVRHVRRRRGDEAADALAALSEPWFWIEYGRFVAEDEENGEGSQA